MVETACEVVGIADVPDPVPLEHAAIEAAAKVAMASLMYGVGEPL
jgi:hypothetical protein